MAPKQTSPQPPDAFLPCIFSSRPCSATPPGGAQLQNGTEGLPESSGGNLGASRSGVGNLLPAQGHLGIYNIIHRPSKIINLKNEPALGGQTFN